MGRREEGGGGRKKGGKESWKEAFPQNKRRAILWCVNPPYNHHYPTRLLPHVQDISLSVSIPTPHAVEIARH